MLTAVDEGAASCGHHFPLVRTFPALTKLLQHWTLQTPEGHGCKAALAKIRRDPCALPCRSHLSLLGSFPSSCFFLGTVITWPYLPAQEVTLLISPMVIKLPGVGHLVLSSPASNTHFLIRSQTYKYSVRCSENRYTLSWTQGGCLHKETTSELVSCRGWKDVLGGEDIREKRPMGRIVHVDMRPVWDSVDCPHRNETGQRQSFWPSRESLPIVYKALCSFPTQTKPWSIWTQVPFLALREGLIVYPRY